MPEKYNSLRSILSAVSLVLLAVVLCLVIIVRVKASPSDSKSVNSDMSSASIADSERSSPNGPIQADTEEAVSLAELHISEIMPSNKCTIVSDDGVFSDWIEIYNHSEIAANLSQYKLTCDGSTIDLGSDMLPAGEYLVIFCPGRLKAEGGTLYFKDAHGNELDNLTYTDCDKDCSVIWSGGNEIHTSYPTPGYENNENGYEAVQSTHTCGSLVINEVAVYNESHWKNMGLYDWVEVKNISDSDINLSDYYLSDSDSDRTLYRLPDKVIAPNQLFVIYCTEDETVSGAEFAAFGLDAQYDKLYLSYSDGSLSDYASLKDIPLGGSFGRLSGENGFFYFTTPTPGYENDQPGYRQISSTPISLEADGVFDNITSVTVSLSGPGQIFYTIGGEVPTSNSTLYTGPFEVNKTCVVRAVCIEEGKLTGTPLSLSYIINEGHTLPVVSLVTAPEDWSQVYGSPALDLEKASAIEYFDGEESFSINCGFKLHGATSKKAQEKKSIKLCFRSRYDGHLEYDLFDNGITDFSSVILRSAQEDYYSTYMRDNLMHQLSLDAFPDELVVQDSSYAVLYVNGQYWGLYNIREAHSNTHYANHKGIDDESVNMYRELINGDCPQLNSIHKYMSANDVSNGDAYNKVCSMLDIDSVMAWTIIQAYSGNYDIHPSNVRFYTSGENQIMSYSLADLDLGFFDPWTFQYVLEMNGEYAYKYNDIALWLLNNPTYRDQFIQKLSDVLMTSLSNESVLAKIDSIADMIRPEIARDRTRWGGTLEKWESMVQDLKDFVTYDVGRARAVANGLRRYVYLTDYEFNNYFGALK